MSRTPLPRLALTIALVIAAVTVASYRAPLPYAATAVAAVFLGATHLLVLRRDTATIRAYGLSLGGLLEPERISAAATARAAGRALLVALVCFALIVPPFWLGYKSWNNFQHPFQWRAAVPSVDEVLGQLFVIALPEEAFFRGYVQTEIDRWLPKRIQLLTLPIGPSIVITSLLFAVCHTFTIPNPARLAVFFPSLLFGALRAREHGIGACVTLHACCNLLTEALNDGYARAGHH